MECYPTGEMADEYRALAMQMYRICGGILEAKSDKVRSDIYRRKRNVTSWGKPLIRKMLW